MNVSGKESFLSLRLRAAEQRSTLRSLPVYGSDVVDLCSNDYLGIGRGGVLCTQLDPVAPASKASRLLWSTDTLAQDLEREIADFHGAQAGLIFNSGYDANVGIFPALTTRHDTIVYDENIHASARDGIRLCYCPAFSFRHNDYADAEQKLSRAKGNIFLVVESLYSMDGDFCCLDRFVDLSDKYGAHIIIDEAHATGVVGQNGGGLVQEMRYENRIFLRLHTFSKALSCSGAIVLGSKALRDYLINICRTFIYTTAMSSFLLQQIRKVYGIFANMHAERRALRELVTYWRAQIQPVQATCSHSVIQPFLTGSSARALALSRRLLDHGFVCPAIRPPSVPEHLARLRVSLHAFNTKDQLRRVSSILTA